jgi:hypothetical protein
MFRRISLATSFMAVLLLVYFAREVNLLIPQPPLEGQDIYYSYVEGKRLTQGKNPYARILDGDMRENQKYATYFPVFYELSYLSQELGLHSYLRWIGFWRIVFMAFELLVAVLLYILLARERLEWPGVFAAAFWLFNRWTLKVVEMENLDFIPIFLLILSLALFSRYKWWSLFLFSLSLGFKQIAIFLIPLYLIWVWREAAKNKLTATLLAGLVIASVPLISGLPFLFWNARGFILSVLFSATRLASDQFGLPSLDVIAGWEGPLARLGMLGLVGLAYIFAFRGYGGRYFVVFVIMSIFVDFNSVLYSQYPSWVVPFIPLIFIELRDGYRGRIAGVAKTLSTA